MVDECATKTAKCDPKAICKDTVESYQCKCPPGFLDASPDPVNQPGRICAQRESSSLSLFLKMVLQKSPWKITL